MDQLNPHLTLDTASGVPIYRQIVDWVKVRVAGGQLRPGDQLPTVRQMAVDLNVNYNTIKSYTYPYSNFKHNLFISWTYTN